MRELRQISSTKASDMSLTPSKGHGKSQASPGSLYGTQEPDAWWQQFLQESSDPLADKLARRKPLAVLDAFSSVGGLSLGARVAGELLKTPVHIGLAVDIDPAAVQVHKANLGTDLTHTGSVTDLVRWHPGRDRTTGKRRFKSCEPTRPDLLTEHTFDLLIGGPPCQGHSTLNNQTRSDDKKNELMIEMAALAVALSIPTVVIENVPNALNDARKAIKWTTEYLESEGYAVFPGSYDEETRVRPQDAVLRAQQLGWPQTRKRLFLVATKNGTVTGFDEAIQRVRLQDPDSMSVWWAIAGLQDEPKKFPDSILHTTPELSPDNKRRMEYLFNKGPGKGGRFDLDDNSIRPKSHQNGHTYPAVYGRMRFNQPAPTITGGFMTPGRGRFIHPTRPRVLTPHEAARIQGFPDWFDFAAGLNRAPTRGELAKWIGDAVPSIMGATAVITALAAG